MTWELIKMGNELKGMADGRLSDHQMVAVRKLLSVVGGTLYYGAADRSCYTCHHRGVGAQGGSYCGHHDMAKLTTEIMKASDRECPDYHDTAAPWPVHHCCPLCSAEVPSPGPCDGCSGSLDEDVAARV